MQIIALEEVREYLKYNLPKYNDPIILISTDYFPGCPKCNSAASVYHVQMIEQGMLEKYGKVEEIEEHKFPVRVFVKTPLARGKPKSLVLGSKRTNGKLFLAVRNIKY